MTCVLIDCDPGLDDAVALLAAFGAPSLNVLAITTVAGNVNGAQTTLNAQIIREAAGQDASVPVCAGAPKPIFRDPVTAEDFHGTTGLGNIDFPMPKFAASRIHAVTKIIETCQNAHASPVTLIVTGPMTNLALALTMAPDLKLGIKDVVLMGGADKEGGNITPYAEFNVYADPHAAAIVFGSGLPIRCLSLDVTHFIRATPERIKKVRDLKSPQAAIAADLLEASSKLEFSAKGDRDAPLHDPSTVVAVTNPNLFSGRRVNVEVETNPGAQFGQTQLTPSETGNVIWYDEVDDDGVYSELGELFGGYE